MERTEDQWQAALFPEITTRFEELSRDALKTLAELGMKSSRDARAHGFVCVHRARQHYPSLWAHTDRLSELEAAAEEIERERVERAEREAELLAAKQERAARVLGEFPWLDDETRARVFDALLAKPFDEISIDAAGELLAPRRLAEAIEGIDLAHVRHGEIVAAAAFETEVLGRPISYTIPDVATVPVADGRRELLLREDLEPFRAQIVRDLAPHRERAVAERREAVAHAEAEAAKLIDDVLSLLDLPPQEAQEARETLVDYAVKRLRDPRPGVAATAAHALEEKARDLIWAKRREAVKLRNAGTPGGWFLSAERKNATVAHTVTAEVELLDTVYRAAVGRRIGLPRDLRALLLEAPFDEAFARIGEYVESDAQSERRKLDRGLERIVERVRSAIEEPGFDVRALKATLDAEFSTRDFKASDAVSRIKAVTGRLVKKARETQAVHTLLTRAKFGHYSDFFDIARGLRRELVLYVGPTNSGKTYHALNTLAEGESGVYLAPLRLLALEGQEEMELRGKPTSFLTGEERDLREGARFVSSTIEMLNVDRQVDTAVVDEVQLLSDPDRGWAWSAAVIGAPAKRIVMTGSPDSVPLVEALAEYLGEPLTVRRLERFTPLHVMEETTPLDEIEPGTALICFSRRDVLGLKQQIERKHSVAVIYGNLSPQVRREEARRFRSGEAKVLIATDAIALGLNLPIKTVLFTTTWKWNGREETRLSASEVRQIGGRAGRFGKHDAGHVGAFSRADLEYIRTCFEGTLDALPHNAQVRPSLRHVVTMSEVLGSANLCQLLDLFRRRIRFDAPLLSASVPDDMLELAAMADSSGMPLEDKFTFACAPVDTRNVGMMHQYGVWMRAFAEGNRSRLDPLTAEFKRDEGTVDPEAFYNAEIRVKTLTVYAWLAYRYPKAFPDLVECDRQRFVLNTYIERTLRKKGRVRRCAQCGGAMPATSTFAICDACYRRRATRKRPPQVRRRR